MLAGRMKLNHFLIVLVLVLAGGTAVVALTCDFSGDERTVAAPEPGPPKPAPPRVSPNQTPDPSPAPAPVPAGGPSERPVDVAVMQWRGKNLGAAKKKDVTKGKPFKVNVYQDAGKSEVNRVKLDLDRDDKFDEKWTFDGDSITRQVAPNDDESYTETYVWSGDAWVKS